jgi:hypothetical protein
MRAVQITRFGGPEVLDVVDLTTPPPRDGEQLYDVLRRGRELRRHPPPAVSQTDVVSTSQEMSMGPRARLS